MRKISAIIPTLNEEKHIGRILQQLLDNNQDIDLEILVVDGMSTDNTRKIVEKFAKKYPDKVRLIPNPHRYVPHALNLGIKQARGDILVRLDAHAIYPDTYIKDMLVWMDKIDAWNIGPSVKVVPSGNTILKKAIAVAQQSVFGVGKALWRIGVKRPTYADTTWLFFTKKETFEKVGLFDTRLIRNQDAEFNARILKYGGKVIVLPHPIVQLLARDSIGALFKQYFQYGYFRALSAKIIGKLISLRQIIPPLFFTALFVLFILSLFIKKLWIFPLAGIFIYLAGALIFSVQEALKNRNVLLIFILPLVFLTMHFAFSMGFMIGFLKFYILKRFKKEKKRHE